MDGQDRILSLFVFIATDFDGSEGVVGANINGEYLPLLGADLARVADLRPLALRIARDSGRRVTLAHFSVRTDQEVLEP